MCCGMNDWARCLRSELVRCILPFIPGNTSTWGDGMAQADVQTTAGNETLLVKQMKLNIEHLYQTVGQSPDYVIRHYSRSVEPGLTAAVVYNANLSNRQAIDDVITHLFDESRPCEQERDEHLNPLHWVMAQASLIGSAAKSMNWKTVIRAVVTGDLIIFVEGSSEAVIVFTQGMEWRAITEPTTQVTIRGPKDSFTESFSTNISLIRRRVKNENLWLEMFTVGDLTETDVAVMYINGLADEKVLQEMRKRLNAIREDGILESGTIEKHLMDKKLSPFPTIYDTERPDGVVGHLMDGRIAVIVDGTPFVLIAPVTFFQFFQSVEDVYQLSDIGVLIRLLRYVGYFISLMLPALYIAAITFHQEMIPTPLLISLVAQREGVPFPVIVEALLMELSFELMREAGVRMPRAVGQAVSIVGALILGQAAVQAGIVSAAMVIIVAATGIASFTAPAFNIAISVRILRFVLMILASVFGLFGILIGLFILVAHLSSLKSIGMPYFAFNLKRGQGKG